MSLTSYRAAPPRVIAVLGPGWSFRLEFTAGLVRGPGRCGRVWKAWRRPTLPRLEAQYHRRRGFSRPSSGWDRVLCPSLWPPGRPKPPRAPASFASGCANGAPAKAGAHPASAQAGRSELCVSSEGKGLPPWLSAKRSLRLSPRRNQGSAGDDPCRWAWAREADRAISTGQLRGLPRFHLRPIDVMVSHGSQARPGFEEGFPLRCFQRLSRPHLATRRCGWRHNRYTRGASLPVLSY